MTDEVGDGDDRPAGRSLESSQGSEADRVESPSMSMAATEDAVWPEDGVRYRVSVEEFGRMVEAGVFEPDLRLELIDGEIFEMSPIGTRHAYVVRQLDRQLGLRLEGRAVVSVQSPILCNSDSEPEPDVAVVVWPDRYVDLHPTAGETLLVVEVANTSLRFDREVKLPIYGSSGIPEAWLVDIRRRAVSVYTQPTGGGYVEMVRRTAGEVLSPTAFPDVEIAVADLLPPQPPSAGK